MLLLYIGVYKALYDYPALAPEELSIATDDLLYVLEKLDIDEWWKVKKRVLPEGTEEVEEPEGLVPLNYIEPAPIVQQCSALYDYDKQTDEELLFKEGDRFNIYDNKDPDWLLAGDTAGKVYGFVPANYVQVADKLFGSSEQPLPPLPSESQPTTAATPATAQGVSAAALPPINFAPPPVHKDRATPEAQPAPVTGEEEEEEEAPPMPTRPRGNTATSAASQGDERDHYDLRDSQRDSQRDHDQPVSVGDDLPQHGFDGEYFTWYIDEIDGRKKRPVVLSVGPRTVKLAPNVKKLSKLRGGASSLDNEWRMKDLKECTNEKKHVFLELKHPQALVELHAGLKDVAEAICSVIQDFKAADLGRGLGEVARALVATTGSDNRKIGRLMFDFQAQLPDELGCREGDEVYVINDVKSKEWWMCQHTQTKRLGVVPASYIEVVATTNLDRLTDGARKQKHLKGRVVEKKSRHRDRNERDKIRERDRAQRDKKKGAADADKSMPNYHRVRTWIDLLGLFKVEAEFLGFVDGKIHLHKTNGVKIAVQASKLSVEDLEYVEKVTGKLLEAQKEEVARANLKRTARRLDSHRERLATAAINDVGRSLSGLRPPLGQVASQGAAESDYDWFEFFLGCGVDIGNCQRYLLNFSRERMDDAVLEDISPPLLRTLGLREGDIIRVMKFLDTKFDRKRSEEPQPPQPLFTGQDGSLKNNSAVAAPPPVDAGALPLPVKAPDDDAWVARPAARSTEDLTKPSPLPAPQTPQYTGSLQDLVNIKPYDANAKPPASVSDAAPLQPALQPTKTAQPPAPARPAVPPPQFAPVSAQKTGELVPVRTGGLVPAQPTGFMAIQPTGFVAIQPTGFMAIQPTGQLVMVMATTGGMPTGGMATGMPATSFGGVAPVLQQGQMSMPTTLFGQGLSLQKTGPLVPTQRTGGQPTGGLMPQFGTGQMPQFGTGPAQMPQMPQFGTGQVGQSTGNPVMPWQLASQQQMAQMGQGQNGTGQNQQGQQNQTQPMQASTTGGIGNAFVPQLSFGKQITGGFMNSPNSLQTGQQPGQPFNAQMNQMTNQFGQTSLGGQDQPFGQQPFGQAPQPSFGQAPQPSFGGQFGQFGQAPQPSFGQAPQPSFGQAPQPSFGQAPQPSFGQAPQPSFGQAPQPSFGQAPQPSFGQAPQPSFGAPQTTFGGQPSFEGFGGGAPLQSQPTGLGFGNSPMQLQQTGASRANLAAATPDNPFGF